MRLTYHTDYALRMLVYLALNRGRPSRVADVAESYGISRNHLLKVALRLGRLGYLTTVRGRSGGIALARKPEDINLGDVVRQIEDDFGLVECMRSEGGTCAISPACRLKGVVRKAVEAFLSVFDGYSLADIAGNKEVLAELLGLPGKTAEPA
ncbi:Rrf2 family transcriptional regulator [Mesorhizobium australicum]|jgi:Rrf2 family nitric oxide-sensitive transcriptional repressor|uniref:Transcriptional regulator, BadM/Rrf2 family n=1 Tax=Mesorhizobium australicum TaxID=536018 RepID=A0A1X7N1H7_9HYPH|nr:Rrf2 family transcriptional regulator [Mesorhizobium australicum]SMH30477.1 transcriptional regulator, BadM/Rrf2 family [Mesorhizobium australicum]